MTRVFVDVAPGAIGVFVGELSRHECRVVGSSETMDRGVVRLVIESEHIPESLNLMLCRGLMSHERRDGAYVQTLRFHPVA